MCDRDALHFFKDKKWKVIHNKTVLNYEISSSTKNKVVVAVIDTGIDYTHEDLQGKIWNNTDEIPDDGLDNDNNGYADDVYGWNFYDNNNIVFSETEEDTHGTMIAGIIAANKNHLGIVGVAGIVDVEIEILKVTSSGEICPASKIIEAIQYAENSGAQICNISMTIEEGDELAETIKNSNMLFIVAAGNNDSIGGVDIDKYPVYPASLRYDNIITVANLSWEGNIYTTSNYGKEAVDIAAPGVCIYSTAVNNHYAYNTGTSFSTPIVTGAAVYLYAVNPTISASEARKNILSNAIEKKDLCMSVNKGRVLKVSKLIDFK